MSIIHKQKLLDLEFGEKGERDIYGLINNYLCIDAKKTKDKYCSFDMEDENNCIEIKTRRYNINSFKEFFFSHKKLKYADDRNKCVSIVFNLTDGVYLFDYTKHQDKVRIVDNQFCRKDRGYVERNKMCYCPTEYFELIKCKRKYDGDSDTT